MPWMTLEYEVTMRFIADIEYAKVIHRITFCYRLQISNRLLTPPGTVATPTHGPR